MGSDAEKILAACAEAKAIREAATPGPWDTELDIGEDGNINVMASDWLPIFLADVKEFTEEHSPPREQALGNARFAAHARNTSPWAALAKATKTLSRVSCNCGWEGGAADILNGNHAERCDAVRAERALREIAADLGEGE